MGQYNDQTKQPSCKNCWAGKYSKELGATADRVCLQCKKGTYSTTIGSNTDDVCTPCAPGKWSNTDGASRPGDCKECEINYFSADEGRKETCEKCASDSTTKKKGQTICVKCDAGQYMNIETDDTGTSIKICRAW